MIWVINSNSNICRIYEYNQQEKKLPLIKEIKHPENRLKTSEIISDKQGHYKSNSGYGSYTQTSDPKEVQIDHFYREIAEELNQGRNNENYDQLIIISPPHLIGLLFQHLDKNVKKMILNNIQKDLLHLSDQELLDFVRTHYLPAT